MPPPPPGTGPHGLAPLSSAHAAAGSAASAHRTVVEVTAKRGGFAQAILFLLTLGIIAAAFVVGIFFGAVAALAPQGGQGIPLESPVRPGDSSQRIAVIAVEGAINEAASEELHRAVAHVLADTSIRAVVLRVDSPGGAVSPSDRMWRDIERLKASGVPVVASYGGIAASGGVYVSCGADAIVCEPTAITGSVGVIASVLTFGDLMTKVGVKPETLVASGSPRKDDANDVYRTWDTADKAVVQAMLDRSYETFVDRVMTGRSGKAPDTTKLRSALDGRVVGAEEAKDLGLVDAVGYLDDAIAEAERRASLPANGPAVVRLYEPASLFGGSMLGLSLTDLGQRIAGRGASQSTPASPSVIDGNSLRDLATELSTPRLEYRLHF